MASDWLKIVMWLGTAKHSTLFQHCVVMLLENLFMTLTPGLPKQQIN